MEIQRVVIFKGREGSAEKATNPLDREQCVARVIVNSVIVNSSSRRKAPGKPSRRRSKCPGPAAQHCTEKRTLHRPNRGTLLFNSWNDGLLQSGATNLFFYVIYVCIYRIFLILSYFCTNISLVLVFNFLIASSSKQ